jgi:GMP synthase-like glutamine amidotransferase
VKPVAIFRFARTEGPGRFGEYLSEHGIPWQLIALDEGKSVPESPEGFSGIGLMGGPMSVNDPLPWIPQIEKLIRDTDAAGKPCIGHCLGGQLISKALGGVVTKNPVREIGWCTVGVAPNPVAAEWFGSDLHEFITFEWHGETFSLPPGAVPILASAHCANQAYVVGKHLGLQCHVEMTSEMIDAWCVSGAKEIASHPGPAVQSVDVIQAEAETNLPRLHGYADRLYSRWVQGLA